MEGKTQQAAAASAAMSERSARKWQRGSLPSESKKARRRLRSRPDPFAAVWESDVVPLLRTDPDGELSATTILEWLDERHPGRLGRSQLRTLQRRIRDYRADTSYGSGRNGWEAERRGTELVSPVGGRSHKEPDGGGDEPVRLTAADFDIDVMATRSAVCPAGHGAVAEYEDEDAPEPVEIHFARAVCEPCALRARCPVRWRSRPELGGEWSRGGAYVLSADLARMNIARRRAAESDGQWRKRYGLRAGIEGTNSEMKRRHGLGRLRVRGGERVRLAVYLKALACNVKRMVGARLIEMDETLARPAALATVPAAA